MTLKWQCYECETVKGAGYRFSHIAGTIFENTNKPLRQWFKVVHLMLTSKKGISALQIQRHMGFGSYGTAHSMCHKIRAALIEPETKLGGIVEVDETFVGGKAKNRHVGDRGGPGRGGIGSGKVPVVGAISRKGKVVARVIDSVDGATLKGFVREVVSNKVTLLVSDEWVDYVWERVNRPGGMEAAHAALRMCHDPENIARAARAVRAPTLIVWGDGDRLFPVADARRLQAEIPGAELCIVGACGHAPPEEKPDEVARALQSFLAAADRPRRPSVVAVRR